MNLQKFPALTPVRGRALLTALALAALAARRLDTISGKPDNKRHNAEKKPGIYESRSAGQGIKGRRGKT